MRRTPSGIALFLFLILIVIIEYYSFTALRSLISGLSLPVRRVIMTLYGVLSALVLISFLFFQQLDIEGWRPLFRNTFLILVFGTLLGKLITAVIMGFNDIVGFIVALIRSLTKAEPIGNISEIYTRSEFVASVASALGIFGFLTILSGARNKYNYKVHTENLKFEELPSGLKGLKIVQISDIHSGSFDSHEQVAKGVQIINELKPDLVLFTGDLVNSESSEIVPYMDIFGGIKASYGVYSILGNHDYGDYHSWPSEEVKKENFEKLLEYQAQMGWKMLCNEVAHIQIKDCTLALLGVENWSASSSFPKYGDLKGTYAQAKPEAFKILMSHDPSHWDAQVHSYADIHLTLSGHTHGMQLGVEIGRFRWSPAQYVYKQWAGLYKKTKQMLYVNRGYGFLGYPGRVGILPEITVINLV